MEARGLTHFLIVACPDPGLGPVDTLAELLAELATLPEPNPAIDALVARLGDA